MTLGTCMPAEVYEDDRRTCELVQGASVEIVGVSLSFRPWIH